MHAHTHRETPQTWTCPCPEPLALWEENTTVEKQLKPGQGAGAQRCEMFECCEVANGCMTNDVGFMLYLVSLECSPSFRK